MKHMEENHSIFSHGKSCFYEEYKEIKKLEKEIEEKDSLLGKLPLKGYVFTFTGKIDKLTRIKAMSRVVRQGGKVEMELTHDTNYLVVGSFPSKRNHLLLKSRKMKKAAEWQLDGSSLSVISGDEFKRWINSIYQPDLFSFAE